MSQTKAELVNGLSINAAAADSLTIDSDGNIQISDNDELRIGTGSDLKIFHDGSNSYIQDAGVGNLIIKGSTNLDITSAGDELKARFITNGASELYYDNDRKLKTTSTGIEVESVSGGAKCLVHAEHDDSGSHAQLHAYTQNNQANCYLMFGDADDSFVGGLKYENNGDQLIIYTNNNAQWYLTSDGHLRNNSDSNKIQVGAGEDLEIYHDGNHSLISDAGTGDLKILTSKLKVINNPSSADELMIQATESGSVELYHAGNKKLQTLSDGIEITSEEAGDAIIYLTADEGDDNSDKWRTAAYGSTYYYAIANKKSGSWVDKFKVFDNGNAEIRSDVGGNYGLYVFNDGNNINRYGVLVQCGEDTPSTSTSYAMGFADGNGTTLGYVKFNSSSGLVYDPFTAAHHCIVPDADNPSDSSMAYPYGTLLETTEVVNIDRGLQYKVQKTQTANSRKVLGAYGGSMNGGPSGETNLHDALILGDGHILVNNAGGNIEVGDGICSSATAGIGQKATANPSMIIGIAQEAVTFTGTETKLVAVQYGLQQFTPWS